MTLPIRAGNGKMLRAGSGVGLAAGLPPVAATAYTQTLSAASSAVGVPTLLTLTPTGFWPPGETLTPSNSSIAGTWSPATIAPSGTDPAVFTFTPSAAAVGSLNSSASPSMTNTTGSLTYTATSSSGIVTSLQLANTNATAATLPTVTFVQGFGLGEVPGASTGGVSLTLAGASVQQDAETYYTTDGSLKQTVLTVQPSSIAGNTVLSPMNLSFTASAPNRTAGVSRAQVASTSDFRLQLTGYDLGTDVLELRVNDVISGGSAFPWGSNPVQGWRQTASGPLKTSWMFWCYAKRVSDGARHKWLKIKVWLDAYGSGQFRIRAKAEMPNTFGAHASGTIGATTQGRIIFTAALLNGGTTLYQWGGANDPRVLTVAGTAFSSTNQVFTCPAAFCPNNSTLVLQPQGGATMPAGLVADTPYVIFWANQQLGPTVSKLYKSRWATGRFTPLYSTITSSTIAGWPTVGGFGAGCVNSAGVNYTTYPLTGPILGGSGSTTGTSTVEPTGAGPVTDGTLVWNCMSAGPISAPGSGNINVVPVLELHAYCGVELCDVATHESLWVGMTPHHCYAAPEISHFTRMTNILPPYDLTITLTPRSTTPVDWPGAMSLFPVDINTTGDGVGDERIAPLNHSSARAILLPFNELERQNALRWANSMSDYHISMYDETTGLIPFANAGTAKSGTPYFSGVPLRTGMRAMPNPTSGVIVPDLSLISQDGYQERYAVYANGTHLPVPALGAYLLTGHDCYLEQMIDEHTTNLNNSYGDDITVGGVKYYRVQSCSAPTAAGRQSAWATRLLGAVNHFLPTDRPERQYVTDIYNDNAAYIAAVYKTLPAAAQNIGLWAIDDATPNVQSWMCDFYFQQVAVQAQIGDHPGWLDFATNHFHKFVVDRMNPAVTGGCGYYAPVRFVAPVSAAGRANALANWDAIWAQSYITEPAYIKSNHGSPASYTGCPTVDILLENGAVGPTSLTQFALNSAIYAARLGITGAAGIVTAMQTRITYAANAHNAGKTPIALYAEYPEFTWAYP